MRVEATVTETTLSGDYGSVRGVCATCTRCGAETESYGTSDASIKRCLVLLREECSENNFYFEG